MTRPEDAAARAELMELAHAALVNANVSDEWVGDLKPDGTVEVDAVIDLAPLVEAVLAAQWRDIASVPEGEHVLLWFPNGERGIGGIEAATVFWEPPDAPRAHQQLGLWTHGGPNSGSDWEPVEQPTHWQPLPPPPKDPPT